MGHRFHAGEVAFYDWGSVLLKYEDGIPAPRRILIDTLTSLLAGSMRWASRAEFRAFVGTIHELVHYCQDIATGAGIADAVASHHYVIAAVRRQQALTSGEVSDQEPAQTHPELLIGAATGERKRSIARWIGENAAPGLNVETTMREYSVAGLLEVEAASRTFDLVYGLRGTTEEQSIAFNDPQVWMPGLMNEEYYDLILRVWENITGEHKNWGEGDSGRNISLLRLCARLTAALVDIALAVPPPIFSEHLRGDPLVHREPTVRFLELMRCLAKCSVDGFGEVLESVGNDMFTDAETALRERCGWSGVPLKETYGLWQSYLDYTGLSGQNLTWQLRKDAVSLREQSGDLIASKHPGVFTRGNLWVFWLADGEMTGTGNGWDFLIGGQQNQARADVLSLNRDLGLAATILAGDPFLCPLAMTHTCSAAEDACLRGHRQVADLPARGGCHVRNELEASHLL